jgi:2-polyprenyl-3-methyl-5-hydroxy-6-metoxy-1,4-benzoquinol methylase
MNQLDQKPLFSCPFCGLQQLDVVSGNCTDYISGENFALLSCQNCQCCFTRSTQANRNTNYYGTDYYNSETGKFSPITEKLFRLNHVINARFLKKYFPAARVLEVGCGRGYLLKQLKKFGAEVYCLESSKAADWILSNQEVKVVAIDDEIESCWPFAPDSFQLIIYWHVLEHLPDPIESLKQATRCLSPGGTLCISVPNVTSLQARLNLATWFHLDVPRHLYHFSKSGLISVLKDNGYQITKVKAGDRIQNLFGWLQSVANLFTPASTNTLYRLLQGGKPLNSANKRSLFVQISTFWLWLPLGILGFFCEEMSRNYGTITIYAQKQYSAQHPKKIQLEQQ